MVDQWTGKWTEEKDYSTYPKEKWCDYDYMAVWIREQKYEPKTSMENLITNIFLHYDCEIEEESSSYNTENGNFEGTYVEAVQTYVTDTGLSEFDYEAQIGVMEMKEKEFTYFENNYWCGFKEGEAEDAKDVIYIDGFPEDDGEGAVVVKVWLTKHNDIIVDWHDCRYQENSTVLELIEETKQKLLESIKH